MSRRLTKSFSVRRKSLTSVCRHSTSSTRKTPQYLGSVKKSLGVAGAVAAAAGAAAAGAAGEVASAVAVVEAAAGPGDIAASARSVHFPTTLMDMGREGRAPLAPGPAPFYSLCRRRIPDQRCSYGRAGPKGSGQSVSTGCWRVLRRRRGNPKNVALRW
jgi:hypothetical protein